MVIIPNPLSWEAENPIRCGINLLANAQMKSQQLALQQASLKNKDADAARCLLLYIKSERRQPAYKRYQSMRKAQSIQKKKRGKGTDCMQIYLNTLWPDFEEQKRPSLLHLALCKWNMEERTAENKLHISILFWLCPWGS